MASNERPNILWICTDQQRFDTLGCYGNDVVETPVLDSLADRGIRFDQCFSQSPVCTPSRASFLTGRYPRTTGCRQNGQPVPESERFVTQILAERGYNCGLAGKLHVSPSDRESVESQSVSEPLRRVDDGYSEFHWSHSPTDPHPSNAYHKWLKREGVSVTPSPYEGSEHVRTWVDPEYHQTTWCIEEAANFIEAHESHDDPWLFSLNLFDPHPPFDPPESYLERYVDRLDEIHEPNYERSELDDKPQVQRDKHRGDNNRGGPPFVDVSDDDHMLIRAAYYAMVDLIDDQIGRLFETLEQTGQREDTLVVFMSDHGEMLGDHGLYAKGPYFYDPAVRVPLIVSQPGVVRGGMESDAIVELVDVAPTLLEAAGIDRPTGMQGRSLWSAVTGEIDINDHRDSAYCEFYNASTQHTDPRAYATMVRTDDYKLVSVHGRDEGELYDLASDPDEMKNLWYNPAYESKKCELLDELAFRMAETVDPLPERVGRW